MEKQCAICGKQFKTNPASASHRKTCSHACRAVYLRKPYDSPCADCGQSPRMKGNSYCLACNRRKHLETYYRHKTSPDTKHLTPEEKHQYKLWRARKARAARKYYRTHYEMCAHDREKRRANKHGVICDLTLRQWQIIKAIYGSRCAYCGRKVKRLTKDHIVPLSKGGTHTVNNIVPACKSCNLRKYVGIPGDYQPILVGHGNRHSGFASEEG